MEFHSSDFPFSWLCEHVLQRPYIPKPCCPCLPFYPPDTAIRFPPGSVVWDYNPPPTKFVCNNPLTQYHIGFPIVAGMIQQAVEILEVPDAACESARPYVHTPLVEDPSTCICSSESPRTPCFHCPCFSVYPRDLICTFPPNLVHFYQNDSVTPLCLSRTSTIETY